MTMQLRHLALASGLCLATLASTTALAQSATDRHWAPWLGCWQLLDENLRDGPDDAADPADWSPDRSMPTEGVRVCVAPAKQGEGVTLTTVVEQQTSLEETIVADGARRPIAESGCEGWQQAEWSKNGLRLFARAELTCPGESRRTISGLTTMAPNRHWIDVQVVQSASRESIRIRRYRRAPDQKAAAPPPFTGPPSYKFMIEDVAEASAKLLPSTLEAALIETNATFPLNSKRLIELDDAGVPDRVIDLMVALSFPRKFVVERQSVTTARGGPSGYGGYPVGGYDSWFWSPYGYSSWPYYYAPFGYSSWGYYDSYYYGTPTYVVVGGGGSGTTIEPSGHGRVVDGLGYTRVSTRQPTPVGGGSAGYGVESSGGGSSSSGGSGGGSVTSGGYSSGGGGGSGVTAVARPPQ